MITKENFKVNYLESEAGWIRFNVICKNKTWGICASHWLDPFGDLFNWLEQIIDGKNFSSFYIDEEGSGTSLSCFCISDSICNLKIELKDANDDIHLIMESTIDTYSLISEFYNGLIDYSLSYRYRKDEWTSPSLEQKLKRILELQDYDSLERLLLQFNSRQLEGILYFVASLGTYNISESKNYLLEFMNKVKKGEYPNYDFFKLISIYDYEIDEKFNIVTSELKKQILRKSLGERANGYNAIDLFERKSLKIENWLSNK